MYVSADLSLDIVNLCFLHQSSIVLSVFWNVARISSMEGPCIMIVMSSAKTTICEFGALANSAIRSLMMFHKVGPKTDPCAQPLVTHLELDEFPHVTWAVRSLKKSLTML
jgi:hypothetical protein